MVGVVHAGIADRAWLGLVPEPGGVWDPVDQIPVFLQITYFL